MSARPIGALALLALALAGCSRTTTTTERLVCFNQTVCEASEKLFPISSTGEGVMSVEGPFSLAGGCPTCAQGQVQCCYLVESTEEKDTILGIELGSGESTLD